MAKKLRKKFVEIKPGHYETVTLPDIPISPHRKPRPSIDIEAIVRDETRKYLTEALR